MFVIRIAALLLVTFWSVTSDAVESEPSVNDGHRLLQEGKQPLVLEPGERVGRLAFNDLAGKPVHLSECLESGPVALLFLSTRCPLVKQYSERLKRLHESYSQRGLTVIGIFSNADETDEGIQQYVNKTKYPFRVIRDVNGYVARRLGATMTPQAFVIDQETVLRFRGAIDDSRVVSRVKTRYLVAAIDAVLAGEAVESPSTRAMGCTIHARAIDLDEGTVTYSGHIARILQDNCQSCHRAGQVAPFALTNYEEALTWATEIQAYTHDRLMPPWKATPEFGSFKNDVSLSQLEVDLLANWAKGGSPLGNADEVPPSPKFNDGWAFGEPDLIVEMPEEYVVAAEGEDDYRHFVIPYQAERDGYVEAVDVRPGNRNVVHHVIAYVDTSGKARELDAADEGPGYTRFGDTGFEPVSFVGGWAPGNLPIKTPPGSGSWLPKKCDIVLQVHYYRSGVEERDRTKVGIYFSKHKRPVRTRIAAAINTKFVVPPGDGKHTVRAQTRIHQPSYLFAVTPHMHLIGKSMKVTAELPDGTALDLVNIGDWDFNWQVAYQFKTLQFLPAGTQVKLVAVFDNSAENPNNPNDPPQAIGWGEKTTDEMCIAFLGLLRGSEYDPKTESRREQSAEVVKLP